MRTDLAFYIAWGIWTLSMFLEPQTTGSILAWMAFTAVCGVFAFCQLFGKTLGL